MPTTQRHPGDSQQPDLDAEEAVLAHVRDAIRGSAYGSVVIKIHQGEVVGIETSTRIRLKNAAD